MEPITRGELYIELVKLMAKRSTCNRANVGCVIVKEGRIIVTGYNGSPSGTPHCIDVGCLINEEGRCIRTVHAEAGAISFAAKQGIALEGTTLYVNLSPCMECAKLIVNAGIKKVCYLEEYRKTEPLDFLRESRITVIHLGEEGESKWEQMKLE